MQNVKLKLKLWLETIYWFPLECWITIQFVYYSWKRGNDKAKA